MVVRPTVGPGQADLEKYGYFPLPNQFQSNVLSAANAIS
jgi:phosphate transport system substrate-binding protein